MKKIVSMSLLLLVPSFCAAMEVTRSSEQESSQVSSALSYSGNVRAVFNNKEGGDMSLKIYDAQTGELISDLGQYSIGIAGEEGIKSIRFNGDSIIYLLDSNGKLLKRVLMDGNYQYRTYESLFSPVEMALEKGFPL